MMVSLRVATTALLVASGLGSTRSLFFRNTEDAVGAQEKIASFEPEDVVISLGGPDPENPVDGLEIQIAFFDTLPSLEGQGVSIAVVNIDACTINPPHTHPRAAEIVYLVKGDLRVGFTEENGGNRAIINDLSAGDVTFFPKGLIHYQQNLGCTTATLVSAANSEDPGIDTITRSFFNLPAEAIKAVVPIDEADLEDILTALPTIAATSRQECLEECGLTAGGDGVCSNGISGVQLGDICCSLSCGTCGGLGCAGRDGGGDECCTSVITNEGVRCSDSGVAPCIVDDD